jgi:broad specificity phosphatase PhoE
MTPIAWLVMLLVWLGIPASAADADQLWDLLRSGRQVIMIRHAITTPGVGDPPGFRLDDCATQRNLTDEGRAHAQRLGEAFRARGIPVDRVLSSPWCRCVETARLAFNVAPHVSTPLSNLFGRPEAHDAQVRQLGLMLSAVRSGGNLVLVTHGSTIQAVTGVNPATAEMVVVMPQGTHRFAVVGRLRVP